MPRRSLANPLALRRLGVALVLLGAGVAALAVATRASLQPGTPAHSATLLLALLGGALAIGGAFAEARAGDILLTAGRLSARRRAVILALIGFVTGLTLFCAGSGLPGVIRAPALVASGGFGLGGLLTLVWHDGLGYAAARLERRER